MKRLLTSRRALGILVLVTLSTSSSVHAADEGWTRSLSFATGWFDCNRRQDEAFETRLEYRVGRARRPLRGVAVAALTDDSTLFVGAGVGYQIDLGRRWAVTPVFVPGYYRKGNGKDLGYSLEFRSQVELGYTLAGGARVAIAFSHLSNGGLGSRNPGEESLTIGFELPLARRGSRPPARESARPGSTE
jgi:hypothetical protein